MYTAGKVNYDNAFLTKSEIVVKEFDLPSFVMSILT